MYMYCICEYGENESPTDHLHRSKMSCINPCTGYIVGTLPLTTLSVLPPPPFTDTGGETEVGVGGGDSEVAVRYFSLALSASLEWPEETSAAVRTSQLVSSEPFNHSCSRRACSVMCVQCDVCAV